MNAHATPIPAPPRPEAPRDEGDLDARIERAERGLIARQERLFGNTQALGERVRGYLTPRRWLIGAASALTAVAGLVWLWRHGLPPGRALYAEGERAGPAAGAGSWVRGLGLLWPILPRRWRERVSPAAQTLIVSVVLPLLEHLLVKPSHPPLSTAPEVDLERYAGDWFEIARLPGRFAMRSHGQPSVRFVPTEHGFDVVDICPLANGGERVLHGVARVAAGGTAAQLQISFAPRWLHWLPRSWAEQWILQLDADYRVAVVGSPARDDLRLLARERQIPQPVLQGLLQRAAEQGFAVDALVFAGDEPRAAVPS